MKYRILKTNEGFTVQVKTLLGWKLYKDELDQLILSTNPDAAEFEFKRQMNSQVQAKVVKVGRL